ncbi:MAG: hypothetical protein JNM57_15015 [Cyclobacteriaceae bacterium]|nr:hypothetical protein [Cyclobacteriaceae bacterium]
MKYIFIFLLLIHGLIHLMGFAKAFNYAPISQLTRFISKPLGLLWLAAALLFVVAAILYGLKTDYAWMVIIAAVMTSQILIVGNWQDARAGTILNAIIVITIIPFAAEWWYVQHYKRDVATGLRQAMGAEVSLLTLNDVAPLPEPVQRYIVYSGSIDKPKIRNFKIEFEGEIRGDTQSPWMPFTREQYNVIDPPTRLFFMKATMKGLPVSGYHHYKNGVAVMDIRLLSLFRVQYQAGREMDVAETVTWFNDVCLLAPAALIDPRIQWQSIDSLSARATFHHQNITISATLFFNSKGELINFISDDRYYVTGKGDLQKERFSTPAGDYRNSDGRIVMGYGEAVWKLGSGDLTYGHFRLKSVAYNVAQ